MDDAAGNATAAIVTSDPPIVHVVDDNDADFVLLSEAWRDFGTPARLEHFRTGAPLLASLSGGACPQLILLDFNLPVWNGAEVLRHIRAIPHAERIPVVICSSSHNPKHQQESARVGAAGFFSKPNRYADFQPFVRALCALVGGHPGGGDLAVNQT